MKRKAETMQATSLEALKESMGACRVEEREDRLPVQLTDAELRDVTKRLREVALAHDELEVKAKEAARQMKEELGGMKTTLRQLTEIAGTGIERRKVPVADLHDARTWMVVTVRLDTMEEVTRRPMREDESERARQPEMFS